MEIRVDGYRSTNESWLFAHRISSEQLPKITVEEKNVAEKLGLSPEEYLRSRFAGDLSRGELEKRASVVGDLVAKWMHDHSVAGSVASVWLKTFEGKFRVEVVGAGGGRIVFLDEELVDELLNCGSREAEESIDRLLSANFTIRAAQKAS